MSRFQKQWPSRRVGFTLIEMVIALLLGSILLVAIGSVTRRVLSDWSVARVEASQGMGLLELRDQLSRDLTNARRARIGQDKIELQGFLYRDPETLSSTQRLANVSYEIRKLGEVSVLVRVQFPMDGNLLSGNREPFTEIMHVGADRMLCTSDRVVTLNETSLPKAPGAVKIVVLDRNGRVLVSLSQLRLRNQS